MAAIFGPGGPIILLWTVWGDRFSGGRDRSFLAEKMLQRNMAYSQPPLCRCEMIWWDV